MSNSRETRGPAFEDQAPDYPWPGSVPVRVRMTKTVHSDGWWGYISAAARLRAVFGQEYEAYTNRYGAVSVWVMGEKLGVKPDEFQVVEFCEMQAR